MHGLIHRCSNWCPPTAIQRFILVRKLYSTVSSSAVPFLLNTIVIRAFMFAIVVGRFTYTRSLIQPRNNNPYMLGWDIMTKRADGNLFLFSVAETDHLTCPYILQHYELNIHLITTTYFDAQKEENFPKILEDGVARNREKPQLSSYHQRTIGQLREFQ